MNQVFECACHCGNLHLTFEVPSETTPTARACNCNYCQARQARWTAAPDGRVRLAVEDERFLGRYRFGTETADFVLCQRCGTLLAATSEIDGRLYSVVNVDLSEALRQAVRSEGTADFSQESQAERLARRKNRWTPAVWVPWGS